MLCLIDNYDSFTYNIVQYLGELGSHINVIKNDEKSVSDIRQLNPERLVISPGPCTPTESGVSMPLIKKMAGKIPILGICLGHEAIGQAFGGDIVHAKEVMHGKTSLVHHKGVGVFAGLPSPFKVARYHSLVIDSRSLPSCLEVTAWTEEEDGCFGEIMGIRHKTHNIEGVQFHPESILSEHGHALLKNFLEH